MWFMSARRVSTATAAVPSPTKAHRAVRAMPAEQVLRAWAVAARGSVAILRAPGIYAAERLPLERLRQATPALRPEDDVYTNHIHADDLAQLAWLALYRTLPGRAYNACDDTHMKMAAYFDLVADAAGLARPPRLSRAELERTMPPLRLSFMSESRRLVNTRIKRELRARLIYPQVQDFLDKGGLSKR
jgi:nucleoside-diphosphate-sugar epimerase